MSRKVILVILIGMVALSGPVAGIWLLLHEAPWWGPLVALAISSVTAGLMSDALDKSPDLTSRRSPTAWTATSLAAMIAGSRRKMLDQWRAHLEGGPENRVTLTPGQQRRYAAGFVVAALRMRLHDMLGWTWHPVDWMLSRESRTNSLIATVVGTQAIYIVGDGGLIALVTEIWEPCGILGGALYVLARWLRRVRGIELATTSPPPDE